MLHGSVDSYKLILVATTFFGGSAFHFERPKNLPRSVVMNNHFRNSANQNGAMPLGSATGRIPNSVANARNCTDAMVPSSGPSYSNPHPPRFSHPVPSMNMQSQYAQMQPEPSRQRPFANDRNHREFWQQPIPPFLPHPVPYNNTQSHYAPLQPESSRVGPFANDCSRRDAVIPLTSSMDPLRKKSRRTSMDEIVNNETILDLIACQFIKNEQSRSPYYAITTLDKKQMKSDFIDHLNVEVAIERILQAGKKPPGATKSFAEDATDSSFLLSGQQCTCSVRYVVMRFKNHFAYYKSRSRHTHVAKKGDNLPPKLRMMIHKIFHDKDATKSLMIKLDSMDEAELNDIFLRTQNILNKADLRQTLHEKIKNRICYMR